MAHLILGVQPHGVAYRRGIRAGDSLVAINGEPILDEIDYQALSSRAIFRKTPYANASSIPKGMELA